jgi:outer membrane protein assembly factor BamB
MPTDNATHRKPLRLWPGVALAIVLVIARYILVPVTGQIEISSFPLPVIFLGVGLLCSVGIVLWWLFFSRAPWSERLGAIVLMIVAVFAIRPLVDESLIGGMMGAWLYVYSTPVLTLALVVGAVAGRRLAAGARRATLAAAILLAAASFTLIRTAGVQGVGAQLHWRWTPTPEQLLLAQADDKPLDSSKNEPPSLPPSTAPPEAPVSPKEKTTEPVLPDAPPAAKAEPAAPSAAKAAERLAMSERGTARVEWPGFRGPRRDSIIRDLQIRTDWSASPPVEMWRRPIGPGWSSFAVDGDFLYTQEQRGEHEVVACYRVSTGKPVWRHRDPARFWESNGGAGPRGTPAIANGRVYAFGATGILNALDARTGAVVWSRNAATDTEVATPFWGFSSSPLVLDDIVIVAASGRLAAYDAATGKPRWFGPTGGAGYSSPHLMTIDGVTQVLLQRGARTTSVAPADGTILWEHSWQPAASIVQPAAIADGDILITTADAMGGQGMRRLAVDRGPGGWNVQERWTSRGLKPYFNDFVVHEGHAYGFDGSILSCVDVADGARKWKGGRYGNGQLVLLPDQDVLLVLSEEGELALVKATPDQYSELARFKAIEGKTWNHPVLVGDVLLVRNGEEMAAFRLSRASS